MQAVDQVVPNIREPMQGRSRASFERMMEAAEHLLTERGSDDFTLNDISRTAKVSIGSIYCRVDSKDDLVHAVQVRVLKRIDAETLEMVATVRERFSDLIPFVQALVDGLAETLSTFAPAMRPFMLRASSDPIVAQLGKASYLRTAQAVQQAFLEHRHAIAHPDPEHATDAAFRILYAALARYLGFGSSSEAAGEGDWRVLKRDLADMTLAFLGSRPASLTD